MKMQAKAGAQFCALDDDSAGEGLAIFLSQGPNDSTSWKIEVFAITNSEELFVGQFWTSPPNATTIPGQLTRQVGAAVCPGAISWKIIAYPSTGPQAASNEVSNLSLVSSKCCTAPVGVSRVGERYAYAASFGPNPFVVSAGQVVTAIRVNSTGAGTVKIGTGPLISVVTGTSLLMEPGAPIAPGSTIAFANCNWLVEYLEGA